MAGPAVNGGARGHGGTERRERRLSRVSVLPCLCASLFACGGPAPNAPRERVYIPRGASLAAVSDSLAAHRVVTSPRGFRLYGRFRGLGPRVQPGLYEFPHGERWRTVVAALKTGRTADILFTVPEGRTVVDIADLAAARLRLHHGSLSGEIRDSFLAAARDPALRAAYGIAVPRGVKEPLEGYLLPETYRVGFDASPRDIVVQMLKLSAAVWDSTADRRAGELGLTRQGVLTLASIVEAEARVPSERRRIAGVYYNRVRRHMPLQADPTVIYALGKHVTRVLYRHLQIPSAYNTYRVSGLPPGPINNPGAASIKAALDPEPHNLLFFVARPDGRHMFSRTPREHADSVAVARVLRAEWQAHKDSLAAAARDSVKPPAATPSPRGTP